MEAAVQTPTDFLQTPELLPQDAPTITVVEVQIATAGLVVCKAPSGCIYRDWCPESGKCHY
jgi:hypothetical protein